MPISSAHVAVAGKYSLEHFVRNPPEDQIRTARPWIRKLRQRKDGFGGGNRNIVYQLMTDYDENGEWFYGDQDLSYNRRDGIEQARFPWRSFHDGYTINTDDLIENGIRVTGSGAKPMPITSDEQVQLTNLFTTRNTQLVLGFERQLDREFHRNGAASTDAVKGLDHLVSNTPTAGTVGSINRATAGNSWWRNNVASAALTDATIQESMEVGYQQCQRNGGMPDFIMMGTEALKVYRSSMTRADNRGIQRVVNLPAGGAQPKMDAGIGASADGGVETGLVFKGVPVIWNPVFLDLDGIENPTNDWEKRIYMLNCMYLSERPVTGYDEVNSTQPTIYSNPDTYYFRRVWRGAMPITRANAQWVGWVA